MNFIFLFSFFISMSLTYVFLPMLTKMVGESNLVCLNYKNKKIPTAMGLTFIFTQTLTLGMLKIFLSLEDQFLIIYLIGFIFIGFLGLIDDTIGDDKYKGLRGHLGAFLKGELTTGNIKALLGGFIALYISSYFSNGLFNIVINALLIALLTNFMNLFDLRPGRAGKLFIFISLVSIILNLNIEYNYILYSLIGSLIIYMKYDLKAQVMMGDTGSNVLGYTLGFYFANTFNIYIRVFIVVILLVLHLIAEKVSFTKIIRNSKILNYIDMIGR